MKVLYTDEALRDLDEILEFIELNYPTITAAFEKTGSRNRAAHSKMAEERGGGRTASGRSRRSAHSISVQAFLPHYRRCD